MDPRSAAVDGGIFSRAVRGTAHTPRIPQDYSIITGTNSTNNSTNISVQSIAAQQLQQSQSSIPDNRLKNFGTTYLSDTAPRATTATSLDGSRRRWVCEREREKECVCLCVCVCV